MKKHLNISYTDKFKRASFEHQYNLSFSCDVNNSFLSNRQLNYAK